MDITCYYDGFHADLNETLFVGKVNDDSKRLVQTAYDSLMAAVNEGSINKQLLPDVIVRFRSQQKSYLAYDDDSRTYRNVRMDKFYLFFFF